AFDRVAEDLDYAAEAHEARKAAIASAVPAASSSVTWWWAFLSVMPLDPFSSLTTRSKSFFGITSDFSPRMTRAGTEILPSVGQTGGDAKPNARQSKRQGQPPPGAFLIMKPAKS